MFLCGPGSGRLFLRKQVIPAQAGIQTFADFSQIPRGDYLYAGKPPGPYTLNLIAWQDMFCQVFFRIGSHSLMAELDVAQPLLAVQRTG